jgi:hypothetical protein
VASTAAMITDTMTDNTAEYIILGIAAVITTTAIATIIDSLEACTVASKTDYRYSSC